MNKIKSPQSLCASVCERERARSKCFPLNVHTYFMYFDNTANSSHTSYINSQFNQARTIFHLTGSLSFNFWINDSRGRELHTDTRNTLSTQGLYTALTTYHTLFWIHTLILCSRNILLSMVSHTQTHPHTHPLVSHLFLLANGRHQCNACSVLSSSSVTTFIVINAVNIHHVHVCRIDHSYADGSL